MGDIRCTNIRFNLDNPLHHKAWEYLQEMNKGRYKSYSNIVITAIVEYFERLHKSEIDPYFTTKEKEDEFIERIITTVDNNLKLSLPNLLIPISIGNVQSKKDTRDETSASNEDDIDWDFVGQ